MKFQKKKNIFTISPALVGWNNGPANDGVGSIGSNVNSSKGGQDMLSAIACGGGYGKSLWNGCKYKSTRVGSGGHASN